MNTKSHATDEGKDEINNSTYFYLLKMKCDGCNHFSHSGTKEQGLLLYTQEAIDSMGGKKALSDQNIILEMVPVSDLEQIVAIAKKSNFGTFAFVSTTGRSSPLPISMLSKNN